MMPAAAWLRHWPFTARAGALAGVFFLFQVALSMPLWTGSERMYPLVPMGGPAHFPWQGRPEFLLVEGILMIVASAALVFFPRARAARIAWLVILAFLIGRDVNRLQVWVYFYALVAAATLLDEATARQSVRWLLAAVYVWGGLNKLTPYFAEDNWTWLVDGFPLLRPLAASSTAGYAVALFELLLGLALCWPRTRTVARWAVLAFHGFIVLALSPWALDWNTVVIPWNAAMAALVWVAFRDGAAMSRPRGLAPWALWALAWIMPALQPLQAWPYTLSWTMYDNAQSEGTFAAERALPDAGKYWPLAWYAYAEPNNGLLYLGEWGQANLHVPPYPEPGAWRKVGALLCRSSATTDSSGLFLLTVNRWDREKERIEHLRCTELQPDRGNY